MRARSVLSIALLAMVALAAPAHADDAAWTSVGDAMKKRGSSTAFIVLFAKEDSDTAKAMLPLFADKKLEKVSEGVVAVRIGLEDAATAKELGLPEAPKKETVAVLDGYGGVVSAKESPVKNADGLARLVKKGQDATKKKKETEKKLDAAVAKAKTAAEKGDTRTACEQYQGVAQYADKLPCEAVEAAKRGVEELQGKGLAELEKARELVQKSDFARANQAIAAAQANYPLPAVHDEAKKVKEELSQALQRQQGGAR